MFDPNCVYGQVINTRRKNRIVQIERKLIIGDRDELEEALEQSENSETMNTSFVKPPVTLIALAVGQDMMQHGCSTSGRRQRH